MYAFYAGPRIVAMCLGLATDGEPGFTDDVFASQIAGKEDPVPTERRTGDRNHGCMLTWTILSIFLEARL